MAPNKKEEGEFVKALVKISDKLDSTLRCISAALMVGFFVVMLVALFLQVFFRFVLNSPIGWTEERNKNLTFHEFGGTKF